MVLVITPTNITYKNMEIHALVEKMLSEDADFQATLETLPDEEIDQALADKKAELVEKEFSKLETEKSNQKIRAEKAEALARQLKTQPIKKEESETPKLSDEDLSLKYARDAKALSDVHEDDIEWLANWAKFNKLSIADAKKGVETQAILKIKAEERKTAEATNTGTSKKSSSKISEEELLNKVKSGVDFPDDEASIQKIIAAKQKELLGK